MYGMNKSDLRLLPHDDAWQDDFAAESKRIKSAVADSSVCIEHVGSTSIPGIHAKPILDLAILCGKGGLDPVVKGLRELEYEYRGRFDDESGHFYAVREKDNIRYCQAHIYTEANEDWDLKLRFRDALREDFELARAYNDYKLELARTAADKTEYAAIKTKWLDQFILKVL